MDFEAVFCFLVYVTSFFIYVCVTFNKKIFLNILDDNMNPVAPNISWLDRTPFLGHLNSIVYFCRGQRELAAEALTCARHNTAIPLFGVFGGLLTGQIGSFFGGMLASRSFVGFLYLLSYGYAKK